MSNMRYRSVVALSAVALTLFGLRAMAASWVPSSAPQPGGNIAPMLNTSAQDQTKTGGLIVQGAVTLDASGRLVIGESPANKGAVCLPNPDNPGTFDCRKGWSELTTNPDKLNLFPTDGDFGYVTLKGPTDVQFGAPDDFNATVRGTAGQPTTKLSTYGIFGEASSEPGPSYGIYAPVAGISSNHRALFATTAPHGQTNGKMWAGYFNASLLVTDPKGGTCRISGDPCVDDAACGGVGDSCIPYPSVAVGGNGPGPGLDMSVGYICLNSVCRSQWPDIHGIGYWSATSPVEPLAQYAGRSLAVGGAASAAGFTVKVTTDASLNPVNADVNVSGNAQFDKYVVGTPTPTIPFIATCGDGICSGKENDDPSSPYYCPKDCDNTPPGNPEAVTLDMLRCPPSEVDYCLPGHCPGLCPRGPTYFLYFAWYDANDLDIKGTKVVVRTDRYPTGPNDTCTTQYCMGYDLNAFPGSYEYHAPTVCSRLTSYYVGLFAYDNSGNYSSGALSTGLCTNFFVDYPTY